MQGQGCSGSWLKVRALRVAAGLQEFVLLRCRGWFWCACLGFCYVLTLREGSASFRGSPPINNILRKNACDTIIMLVGGDCALIFCPTSENHVGAHAVVCLRAGNGKGEGTLRLTMEHQSVSPPSNHFS